jgi:hypothetical protein
MSLHLGVLIYGVAEGTLPGPSAAQSLSRMIADSSMEEVTAGVDAHSGLHAVNLPFGNLLHS